MITDIPRLARRSAVPLYYQLKDILRSQIRSGELQAGAMLPSEHELAEKYEISRQVARRALAELALQGLVVSRRGIGSFVNEPRLTKQMAILGSFTQSLKAVAANSAVIAIQKAVQVGSQLTLDALELPEGSEIVHIQRLGLVDGEPVAVASGYYALEIGRLFLDRDLGDTSLYALLEEHLGLRPLRADWIFSSVPASPELASNLDVREGFPILCNRGTTYDESDAPFEYSELNYRSDRVEFAISAFRRSESDTNAVLVDM